MKYPKQLEKRLAEIKSVVDSWPVDKDLHEVMSWILQFEKEDYDLAIRIIKNLNIIGADHLNAALSVAYSKLLRHARDKEIDINKENTLYTPIGSAGKSGAMVAYNFRLINGLNSSYFLSSDTLDMVKEGKIKNLVLIDDIIATGNQSSAVLKEMATKARTLGIQNVFLMTAIGFKQGIEKLRDTQVADVFSALEYDESDTVTNLDSDFYEALTHGQRIRYKDALANYCDWGYGGIGGLIAFYYNTPNCSLPVIWSSKNGWIPLFPRKFDLKNEGPELYSLDELMKEKEPIKVVEKEECSIYVEGKTEELFIQTLAAKYSNFGYHNINIVSIGPFHQKSLITSLMKYSQKVLFVSDEEKDVENAHVIAIRETIDQENLIMIGAVMGYFDVDKIRKSEWFSKIINDDIFDQIENEKELYAYLENKLIKRPSQQRTDNMRELIDNCSRQEKIDELLDVFKKEDSEI